MKTANCPSCGAQVAFRSAASVMAVCEYCQSTLVRHDIDLEDIGKMAQLAEDASPIRMGMNGRYRGVGFSVIGRIQLKYEQGYWNEWYCLFDDQREGWLSEGSGLFYVTFPTEVQQIMPAYAELKVGMTLKLKHDTYTVTNLEQARCVAGAGELPFTVGAGWEAPSADLRSATQFASIDYSEDPPGVYLGEAVELPSLKVDLSSAEAVEPAKISSGALQCPSCGNALSVHNRSIQSVACAGCGSVVDTSDPKLAIIAKFNAYAKIEPVIALGSQGKLRGLQYTALGFMRRKTSIEGQTYEWDEYLLYSEKEGFCWLTQSEGHWNFGKALPGMPRENKSGAVPTVYYQNQDFRHFQSCAASVSYALGEFNWRVKTGETAQCADYVAPPLMLSKENTRNEITWTISEYLPTAEVEKAFGLKARLPSPRGISPNQPSPYVGVVSRYWKTFGWLTLLVFVIQLLFVAFSYKKPVYSQQFAFEPGKHEHSFVSQPFQIEGRTNNVVIRNQATVRNSWVYVDMNLINRDNGTIYHVGREVSYYFGSDSDGSWSEGSPDDEALLSHIPPGSYLLEVDTESAPELAAQITDRIEVYRGVARWTNFWLAELFLLLFPLATWWRSMSFETRRWAESDHPKTSD